MLLEVKNLQVGFQHGQHCHWAVDGVSFSIHRGETFALLGESGCGKTLTALSLMGLLPPTAVVSERSSISLNGKDLLNLTEAKMRHFRGGIMGMVFQEPMTSLNPVLTVGQQISEVLRIHRGLSARQCHSEVVSLLEQVGIADPALRAADYPHQLSGGMKQRVMVAMALAGEPELLIADEPTTALDVTIQAQVLSLLKELQRKTGMAMLLITHDLGVVSQLADSVAVMYAGHVVEQANARQLFQVPRHPYTQKLFAALPDPTKRGHSLEVIPGHVPALGQEFSRCRFLPRCERATPVCESYQPRWVVDKEQGIRCHWHDPQQGTMHESELLNNHNANGHAVSEAAQIDAMSCLQVKDLKIHFPIRKGVFKRTVGHVRAVDGVDLLLQPGKTLALVGESGSGKTTTGKGIVDLLSLTTGEVQYEGESLRRDVQFIFQDPFSAMNPRMLVGDIITEGMKAHGLYPDTTQREARVQELLKQVGLPEDSASRYPHAFSGGQRQRICIARALAVDPKLIVCDEPTSALDVSVQAQILNLLRALQRQLGLSYLFITHNISVVSYLADEVAVMYLGRIVEQGAVQQVLENPLHPYTKALLAAVPTVDPDQGLAEVVRGEMPSAINPPTGCHFHPRCPHVMPRCRDSYPESVKQHGRQVSCYAAIALSENALRQ